MEYTRNDYRRVYGETDKERGALGWREYLLIAIAAVVLALLAGCDDGQAAEITHQLEQERHEQLVAAHKHATILVQILNEPVTLTVDGEPAARCRPIRRKP